MALTYILYKKEGDKPAREHRSQHRTSRTTYEQQPRVVPVSHQPVYRPSHGGFRPDGSVSIDELLAPTPPREPRIGTTDEFMDWSRNRGYFTNDGRVRVPVGNKACNTINDRHGKAMRRCVYLEVFAVDANGIKVPWFVMTRTVMADLTWLSYSNPTRL